MADCGQCGRNMSSCSCDFGVIDRALSETVKRLYPLGLHLSHYAIQREIFETAKRHADAVLGSQNQQREK